MQQDKVDNIYPNALTDKELIRFAEEALTTNILGMTCPYQQELLKRFENLLGRIADGELVEQDDTNEELQSEISNLEDQVYDLEREVDRLSDELDALQKQPNQ